MKKLVAILLCIMLLCSFAVPVSAASPTVIKLAADKTTVAKGEKVTFVISVSGSNLYTSLRATVNYDTDVFKFSSGKSLLPSDRWFGSSMGNVFVYADQYRESMKNDKFPDLFYDYAYVGDAFSITLEALVDCPEVSTVSVTPDIKRNNDPVAFTVNSVDITVSGQHGWSAWSKADAENHTRSCSKCGTTETAAHDWDNGKVSTPATCAKDGVKTYTCQTTGCNATKTEAITDRPDHTWGSWAKDTDAQHKRTCTVSGCTAFETEDHKWDEGTVTKPGTCAAPGEKTHKCTVSGCNATKIVPTDPSDDHTLGKWEKVSDTKHKRSCTVSGCNYSEEADHKWSSYTVTEAATCVKDGVETSTCTDGCGATRTRAISKDTVAHTWGKWETTGDTQHKHSCTVSGCTASESVDHTWNAGTVTKVATCKEDGVRTITCTGCGAEKTEKIDKLTEHAWGKWTEVDATSHKRTCTVCGDSVSETAKHGETTKWTSDGTQHWHECADCKAKLEAAKHTPGAAATETTAQRCTVCNRILVPAKGHTHKWDTKYTTDAESHWYACSGCNEKKDAKAHDFANDCDPLCETCQYTRETTHKFGTEWSSDETGHFHACSVCGEKTDLAEHAPGVEATETTAQTCTACGFELAPALGHTHVFGEVWEKDDVNHWHVCACGEKADEAAHEWDDGVVCKVCLAEKPAEEDPAKESFPWWIIVVAVVAVGCVVGLVVIGKKKKQ